MSEESLRQALDYHREGRLNDAAILYEQIIEADPGHFDALYLLGTIAHQSGNHSAAVGLVRQALLVKPDHAECYNLQGLALMCLGRAEDAETSFVRAIGLDPQYANAHCNRGIALRLNHELDRAALCFKDALEIDPNHAYAIAGLGQVLIALHRPAEAIPFLQQALAAFPSDANLHCALGDSHHALKRFEEAVAGYSKAVELNPHLSGAWYSRGCAHNSRNEYASAAACFRRALSIRLDWTEAWHNLGLALFQLGQVDEAMELFRQAAGGANPRLPLESIAIIAPGSAAFDNQAVLDARRKWADSYLPSPRHAERLSRPTKPATGILRIGYISSFFQRENWMKPVWGLINNHDRGKFELHLFSDAPETAIRHCYKSNSADKIYDIGKCSNEEVAETIERSSLDLLVDLNGYSAVDRLPVIAMRPAPVIAGWFNMYATTGMSCYDYLIGDEAVIPSEEERFYCEKIIRVPGSYLTFEVAYPVPDVAIPPLASNSAITFGCLASQYKITNEVVAAWSGILQASPGSILFLKNSTLSSPDICQFVHGLFEAHGISAERIRLQGPSDHYEFLKAYDEIDIALDTFPYNGGTTTTEAIWQGVPVIAFWGDRWASRTSASILRAANLGWFVSDGVEGYISQAIALANSASTLDTLVDLRRNMRSRLLASPVCDTRGFAGNMERIYTDILS